MATIDLDRLHDQFWNGDGKDSRGSVPGRFHRERHGPIWTNGGIGWVLSHDRCAYAADVESGRCSRDVTDSGENSGRFRTESENVCSNGHLRGFVLVSNAARARVRVGLHTGTLPLFRLR